jgi:hypothetical protein
MKKMKKTPFVINNYDKLTSIIDKYADKLYDNYDDDVVTSAINCLRSDDNSNRIFRATEREWAFGLTLTSNEGKESFKKTAKIFFFEKLQDDYGLNKFKTFAQFATVITPLDFLLKCAKRIKMSKTKNVENSKSVFGKYAWANDRILSSLTPAEKDTPVEAAAYEQLSSYIDGNTKAVSPTVVSTLKSIIKKGKYSDIIKEPTKKVIMRGMHLDYKQLQTLLGDKEYNKLKFVPGFKKKILKSFTFKPLFNVSSWTTDKFIAKDFSIDPDFNFSIILYAQVSDNPGKLLQCDDGLYNIQDFSTNKREHEVIALGSVKVSSIMIELV